MKLEIGTFPVSDIRFGSQTGWKDGMLQVNRDHLRRIATSDPLVAWADIDVARPGESARIICVNDIIQPKLKAEGPGRVYPGIAGRPVDIVGQGRTHRLDGMSLMICSEMPPINVDGSTWWGRSEINFIDMSGPGAVTPFANLVNLCVSMQPRKNVYAEDWNRLVQWVMMEINDHLAGVTADLEPPRRDCIDLNRRDDSLPCVVFVPVLASAEHRFGIRTSLGTGVYGIGRLTQPWLLQPSEVLDGAICGAYQENFTWPIMETIVPYMCARHGEDLNFVGCIVVRSNWESQTEKQLMANRTAQLAQLIGASGAIVTTNVRGQRFLETILTVQALEQAGINTVLMTEEEDNENGTAPPLLMSVPEVSAVISTGTGGVQTTFPSVKRVIGTRQPEAHWFQERPPIHGRYSVSHMHDFYGFGKQGCLDFFAP